MYVSRICYIDSTVVSSLGGKTWRDQVIEEGQAFPGFDFLSTFFPLLLITKSENNTDACQLISKCTMPIHWYK